MYKNKIQEIGHGNNKEGIKRYLQKGKKGEGDVNTREKKKKKKSKIMNVNNGIGMEQTIKNIKAGTENQDYVRQK